MQQLLKLQRVQQTQLSTLPILQLHKCNGMEQFLRTTAIKPIAAKLHQYSWIKVLSMDLNSRKFLIQSLDLLISTTSLFNKTQSTHLVLPLKLIRIKARMNTSILQVIKIQMLLVLTWTQNKFNVLLQKSTALIIEVKASHVAV